MRKENKIILLICITILINCIIVISFSTEIRKRLSYVNEQSDKIMEQADKDNKQKELNSDKQSSDDSKNDSISTKGQEETITNDSTKNNSVSNDLVTDNSATTTKDSTTNSTTTNNSKINNPKANNNSLSSTQSDQNKDSNDTIISKDAKTSSQGAKGNISSIDSNIETRLKAQFDSSMKQNSDTVGYIMIEGTKIDYPVVQNTDKEYYQYHNFNKEYSLSGAIMLDATLNKTQLRDQKNTIITGNNAKDGTMFADLINYKHNDFLVAHPSIYLQDNKGTTKWQVFSVYYINADEDEIPTSFKDVNEFSDYQVSAKRRSLFDTDIKLDSNKRILTLVTDSFEYANGKTIVQAMLVEE